MSRGGQSAATFSLVGQPDTPTRCTLSYLASLFLPRAGIIIIIRARGSCDARSPVPLLSVYGQAIREKCSRLLDLAQAPATCRIALPIPSPPSFLLCAATTRLCCKPRFRVDVCSRYRPYFGQPSLVMLIFVANAPPSFAED